MQGTRLGGRHPDRIFFLTVPAVVLAPPKVLLLRLGGVGDVLLVTPLIRAIRARHPQAHIAVLTHRRMAPLLAENPRLDEVITLGQDDSVREAAPLLRTRSFSHLLDLEGSLRTRALRAFVPGSWFGVEEARFARWLLARTKRNLLGDGTSLADQFFTAAHALDVSPDGGPVEVFPGSGARMRAAQWMERAGLGQERPVVAFAPGSPHLARRWPVEYWAELIKKIVRTGADAVIVGGPDDTAAASEVALRGGPRAGSAAGELDLQETAALLARAEALVANDGGLLHLASGVGRPVVGLFGPTVRQFGSYPYNAHAAVLERELPCRPCDSRGDDGCPEKHHLCLRAIRPDDVFNVLSRTLAARPDAGAREAPGKATPSPPAPPDEPASGWSLF